MKKKDKEKYGDGEDVSGFWVVGDMMSFENVGFTNTVNNIKYLICADCEVGPIGYHDLTNRTEFYIAVDRVAYK